MQSRRDVLLGSGTAMLAGLAGCSEFAFPGGGSDSDDGPVDWIPASIGDGNRPVLAVARTAAMREIDEIAESGVLEATIDVDPELVDTAALGGASFDGDYREFVVATGDLEEDAAVSAVENRYDASLESDGEYGGYTRFSATDGNVVAGYDGDVVIGGHSTLFESVVDAVEGDGERLVDADEDFERLVDAAGSVDYLRVSYTDPERDGPVLAGVSYDFASGESDVTLYGLYEDESAASEDDADLQQYLQSVGILSDTTESVDGRLVTVTGTVETASIFGSTTESVAPSVAFQFDYDETAGVLEIVHTGGDSVEAGRVSIGGQNLYGHDGNTWDDYDDEKGPTSTVSAGDTIELGNSGVGQPLDSDFELDLVWTAENGQTHVIADFIGPDA